MQMCFVDNWRPQLEAVKKFLESNGVRTGRVRWRKASAKQIKKGARGVYVLGVSNVEGMLIAARKMLPYTLKKNVELRVVIDYYEDRITGDEAIESINEDVISGKRTGKVKHARLPFTHSDGKRLKDALLISRLRMRNTIHVPRKILAQMKRDYHEDHASLRDISATYGYSVTVVRRILGSPH